MTTRSFARTRVRGRSLELSGVGARLLARLPRVGPFGSAMILAAPVVAAALFYVWTHVTTVQLGYALSEAGEAHRTLLEENRGLRIEVAALKAPERLEPIATTRFGMAPPRTEQVIRLKGTTR